MKIAELSRKSGTHRSSIHHYLALGLLPPPETLGPKLHHFGPEHVERLREIKALRSQEVGLAEIRARIGKRRPGQSKPTRPRRRTNRGGDPRVEILDVAARLFLDRGFDHTSVQMIARAAGVGKATVYRHFVSKSALFVESLDRLRFTLVPPETRAQADVGMPLLDELRLRVQVVLSHFGAYRTLTDLLGATARGRDPEVAARARAALHRMVMNVEPTLRRAMDRGEIRRDDSELHACILWGALFAIGDRLELDGRYSTARAIEVLLEFVRRGLAS